MKRSRLWKWPVILIVCAGVAVPLARWWAERSEERFQARVREMPVAELQELAARREWDPMVFYWLGVRLTSEGRHPEALAALARSVALNPGSASSRASLGVALGRADRFSDAERHLKEALALDPRFAFAHFALGSLYVKQKVWEPAASHLKIATELIPGDPEAQYLLARCYGELYQEDRKREILERLVRQTPNDVRVLKELGYVYLFYGKFAQAEANYRRLLALAPDDQEAHYLLGRALAEQANTPEAFATAERELRGVVARVPDEPSVHLALGILHFRRNEPAKAVDALERAIQLGVREQKAWLYLGQAYMRVGRSKEATRTLAQFERRARFKRTVTHLENRLLNMPEATPEQQREKIAIRLRLARAFAEHGNYPRALNNLRIIQEQTPDNPEVLRLAAECRRRMASRPSEPGSGD
jgi:tetratricopeptide (TPR) repeat protein